MIQLKFRNHVQVYKSTLLTVPQRGVLAEVILKALLNFAIIMEISG